MNLLRTDEHVGKRPPACMLLTRGHLTKRGAEERPIERTRPSSGKFNRTIAPRPIKPPTTRPSGRA